MKQNEELINFFFTSVSLFILNKNDIHEKKMNILFLVGISHFYRVIEIFLFFQKGVCMSGLTQPPCSGSLSLINFSSSMKKKIKKKCE